MSIGRTAGGGLVLPCAHWIAGSDPAPSLARLGAAGGCSGHQ